MTTREDSASAYGDPKARLFALARQLASRGGTWVAATPDDDLPDDAVMAEMRWLMMRICQAGFVARIEAIMASRVIDDLPMRLAVVQFLADGDMTGRHLYPETFTALAHSDDPADHILLLHGHASFATTVDPALFRATLIAMWKHAQGEKRALAESALIAAGYQRVLGMWL